MGCWKDYKPEMAMLGLQFLYAVVALSVRSVLLQGMSPRVFVVYRQAIATLIISPIAYFSEGRKSSSSSLGIRSFSMIFVTTLIGVTINQNIYFEGLYLASSSVGSAMGNLVPAITFLIAAIIGLEKVDIRRLSSVAKVAGTLICVGGAICMAFAKGPKLLSTTDFSQHQQNSITLHYYSAFAGSDETKWMIGCLLLFGSCCTWSVWLILQVSLSAIYPNHLCLSAWMCFFGTLQSATLTLFLEPDPNSWRIHSIYELLCALYTGVVGSALAFFLQGWCISQRGPLFTAMFSPLSTVLVTIIACLLLRTEQLYTGSLAGAFAVIAGLYIVLWGKAKDLQKMEREITASNEDSTKKVVNILIHKSLEESCDINLEEPLLSKK